MRNIFLIALFFLALLLASDPELSRAWTQYAHVTGLTAAACAADVHARAVRAVMPALDWAYSGANVSETVLAYQCRHLGGRNCSGLTGTVCDMARQAGLHSLYEWVWECD